ncbi:MAG: TIGR02757 family protein [Anaerohalosphaeraceae bacterium]|nr:TIGR02757 family protein [Anaerohalosphaeraceae bacterium]
MAINYHRAYDKVYFVILSRTNNLRFRPAAITLLAMALNTDKLRDILENLYHKYNHQKFVPPDPLQFVYKYTEPADMEIAGFLAACFAYGSAKQIQKFLETLLEPMGARPAEFIANFGAGDKKFFKNMKYRFNSPADIIAIIEVLKSAIGRFGSLEKTFLTGYNEKDETIAPALLAFSATMLGNCPKPSRGLKYLITSPENSSTCKRMFLFLRWMVRNDNIDSGLWKKIDKSKLIVPIDVHMGRLSKILGLHRKKTYNLKTAIEITEGFRKICPGDPVKYDFALCRIGILENCTGKKNPYCDECELNELCNLKNL